MKDYLNALSYFENLLKIHQEMPSPDMRKLVIIYNNIGKTYQNMGNCKNALTWLERAVEAGQLWLPENDPVLEHTRGKRPTPDL